jgi:nitrate ABC transporter ATP-binding subunit
MTPSRNGLAAVPDDLPPPVRDPAPDARYLEFSRLSKSFPGGPEPAVPVVEDFDLPIEKGEFVCLIGHSGCGKSTVLSIAAGLTDATLGGVLLDGREVTEPGPDRGVVFQSPCLLPWLSALDNVLLGVEQVFPGRSGKQRREIAGHYLRLVGLGDAFQKKPGELSAGMRQRVGIARAFALSPKVLLLDEPFGMLDSLTRYELQQVLIDLWAQDRKTALMVTHDVDEALFLSDRVAMMTSGPRARLGGLLTVPFPRPRDRAAVMDDPRYYELRESLIGFLNSQKHEQDQDGQGGPLPPDPRAEKGPFPIEGDPYRLSAGR